MKETPWWWLGLVVVTLCQVSTGMGDRLQAGIPPRFITSHSGQLSLLPSVGWKMNTDQSAVSDTLWLGSKGKYGSFHLWIYVWVAGKTV